MQKPHLIAANLPMTVSIALASAIAVGDAAQTHSSEIKVSALMLKVPRDKMEYGSNPPTHHRQLKIIGQATTITHRQRDTDASLEYQFTVRLSNASRFNGHREGPNNLRQGHSLDFTWAGYTITLGVEFDLKVSIVDSTIQLFPGKVQVERICGNEPGEIGLYFGVGAALCDYLNRNLEIVGYDLLITAIDDESVTSDN